MSGPEAPIPPSPAGVSSSPDASGILMPIPALPAASGFDLTALQRLVREQPDNGRAWYELGCALNRTGRPLEALNALDCALTLAPDQTAILCERGAALLVLRSFDNATEAFEEVLASQPLNELALFCLANVKYQQRRFADAAALWRQAAGLSDDPTDALENLATTLQRLGRPDEEREVWHEALRRRPQHPLALHHLAALGEGSTPERASDAYIVQLFDGFAREFDATLAAIGYRGPQLLSGLTRDVFGAPAAALDVLDAGCGTGLCGVALRPWARKLIGVDLSEGMLAVARQKGEYDELVRSELTAFLAGQHATFDLVASSDALTYFGELSTVLAATVGALRPGGAIVCSLELMSGASGTSAWRLQPHGRYCHAPEYVREVCYQAGVQVRKLDRDVLRNEAGQPVACLLVAATKAPA